MFANAVEIATHYTRPVIISIRFHDTTLESGMAAFVVVNDEGWIVTAAHLFRAMQAHPAHKKEIAAHEAAKTILGKSKKRAKLPKRNPKWLTDFSYWWAGDGVGVRNIAADFDLDIAIAQLDPFDPAAIGAYPTFKDPATPLRQGTSLCRLGYPFHEFEPTFKGGTFELPRGALPAPRFPLEGIFTRNVMKPPAKGGTPKFIETSSPGLRGQSGGPIFDTDGVVWGIQSSTHHLDLGFSPTTTRGKTKVVEHQFLNVGLGVHPEIVDGFLTAKGVKFAKA